MRNVIDITNPTEGDIFLALSMEYGTVSGKVLDEVMDKALEYGQCMDITLYGLLNYADGLIDA